MMSQSQFLCLKCEQLIPLDKQTYHVDYQCDLRIKNKLINQQPINKYHHKQQHQYQQYYSSSDYNTYKNQYQKYYSSSDQQESFDCQDQKYVKQINHSSGYKTGNKKSKTNKNNNKNKSHQQNMVPTFIKKTNSTQISDQFNQQKSPLPKQQLNTNMLKSKKNSKHSINQNLKLLDQIEKSKSSSKNNNKGPAAAALNRQKSSDGKVQCVNCNKMIPFQQIDGHQFHCGYMISCQFCGLQLPLIKLQQHFNICEVKKLWQQTQNQGYQDNIYANNVHKTYQSNKKQTNYKNYYHQDYSDQEPQYYDQPVNNMGYFLKQSDKKHKGLTNSKLSNLHFSSYKKKTTQMTPQHEQHKTQEANETKMEQKQDQPCPICYMEFQQLETIIKLPCLHGYHPQCVWKWFETDDRCPMCKVKIQ